MSADRQRCLNCRHFRNDPRYLESVFKGMTILSSAYASVRSNDGICLLHDRYLSADACCEEFEVATLNARGSRRPAQA